MQHIITHKWRSFCFVILVTAALGTFLFSSDAFARQRKAGRTLNPPAAGRTGVYQAGTATFTAPIQLTKTPVSPIFFQQDAEPEIKVDVFGNIYVAAINGVPGGTDLWKSTDKGATFQYLGQPDGLQDKCSVLPQCLALGGADDSVDVSPGGYLYVASLYIGSVTFTTSTDGGVGGVEPGQAWTVNPVSTGVPVEDRQWIAAYGPQTVYMTVRQAPGTGRLLFMKSTDAGKTFSAPSILTSADSVEGNLVVDPYNGNLYTTFVPSASPTNINLLKSTDGGATWSTSTVYTGAIGTNPSHKFTILAVDRGGNVHLVFSSGNSDGSNTHVYLMSSSDQGATWLAPVRVDNGTGNATAIQPWVVGGSPGVVDITWIGQSGLTADLAPYDWKVYFAQTTNALSATPTFGQSLVTANRMHDRTVCFNGSGCASGTRDLLEYFTIALDPEGNANIAYPDSTDANNCPADTCVTNAWFSRQNSGPSAYAPPAGPAPSTFSANLSLGSPGGEPGLKVDSHNCIYVTAPGGPPALWKSVNNGASFLPKIDPVADFAATGGDEDIMTVPQANGARPDMLYFADLAQLAAINIAKSTDGGATWFKPGPGGAASEVDASTDRQWLAWDRNVPATGDLTVYEMDHEAASEAIRFNALTVTGGTTDTTWSPPAMGITDPSIILDTTFPNTNPGPVFTDPATHMVYGIFCGSTVRTNRANPPFGKLPNVWEAMGPAPTTAGAPPGPFVNRPVFKGVQDSPTSLPSPAPALDPKVTTYGNNCANDFPSAAMDNAGNIYVTWAMNNSRTNEYMVWFAASHDHGQNFYGPFQVSQGPGAALMPWVAAGDDGRVNIVFYATSTTGDPNFAPNTAEWNAMFAQSFNANAREPVFTISQVSDHVMHKGGICNLGLLCSLNGGNRSLADFFQVAIGPDGLANIIFADNGLSSLHATYARQTSGPLALANPVAVTCLGGSSISPVSAVSRKTHGSSGDFDINLPLTGNPGVECRTGGANGDHKVLISFANAVTVGSASVTSADNQAQVSSFTVNGPVVTVNLTNVSNAQTLTINLTGVNDGTNTGNVGVQMGVLKGDTTADRFVNSADISQTKSQSGNELVPENFREDVTIDGFINSADIAFVKAQSGTGLP